VYVGRASSLGWAHFSGQLAAVEVEVGCFELSIVHLSWLACFDKCYVQRP
jgi:hypothetical protein